MDKLNTVLKSKRFWTAVGAVIWIALELMGVAPIGPINVLQQLG